MTTGAEAFGLDDAEYVDADEERRYRETKGYPKNARAYSERQTLRRLEDLRQIAARCARLVARGYGTFIAPDDDGEILRAAAERYVVSVGTVVEKLHSDYKDQFPDIPWRAITGMRNLVAHHYDKVDHEIVWQSLKDRVPALISALGLSDGPSDQNVLPAALRPNVPPAADPFPQR